MGKPKATPVPDPAATAAAQSAANKETAIAQAGLNNVNQITPDGSLTYSQIGTWADGTPRFQATTALNPTQQASYDQQQQLDLGTNTLANQQLGRISGSVSNPFSYDTVTQAAPTSSPAVRQQVIDALMGQSRARLDPQFAQQEAGLKTDLANQGIPVGSDAWNKVVNNFQMGKNDAYQTAENQAISAGGSEDSRLFNQELTARQQGIQEYTTQRNAPLNEASALLNAQQISNPNFVNTPQTNVAPTDVIGATSLASNVAANNNQQRNAYTNAIIGALAGTGGQLMAAAIKSDRRLKRNIKRVGRTAGGLNVYRYQYRWSDKVHVGVMAQEVRKKFPNAIVPIGYGYMAVDYRKIA